jgi:predicted nucleic acid-binding protein
MPETTPLVINTGPILALVAALGSLRALERLYARVIVPAEVCAEILHRGPSAFAVAEFQMAGNLDRRSAPTVLAPHLANAIDPGEAAVIQIALNEKRPAVCIDETVGRRIARLNGLRVTGSLGVLLKARAHGEPIDLADCIHRIRRQGVWISHDTELAVLRMAH